MQLPVIQKNKSSYKNNASDTNPLLTRYDLILSSYINNASDTNPLLTRYDLIFKLMHLGVFPLNFPMYNWGEQISEFDSRIWQASTGNLFTNTMLDRDPVLMAATFPRFIVCNSPAAARNCFAVEQRRNFQYLLMAL